jgi:hypothetical protein
VLKIVDRLISKMPVPNFENNKLGGFGVLVEVDKTM